MKEKIINILLNPFVISLFVTILIIFLLPDRFSRFKFEIIEEGKTHEDVMFISYYDLNNDNKTEKISYKKNILGNAAVNIYSNNSIFLDQWNLKGRFPHVTFEPSYFDVNKDGYFEVYIITQKTDSAFLNIIHPWEKANNIEEIFICTIQKINDKADFIPGHIYFNDLNNDNNEEIIFSINAGFSLSPRKVFAIDLINNNNWHSKHLGNKSNITDIVDIDNDGRPEILLTTNSSGNFQSPDVSQYSDYSTWITILNNQLEFYIDPIEISIPFSAVELIPVKSNSNGFEIVGVINSRESNPSHDKLIRVSNNGINLTIDLDDGIYRLYNENYNSNELLLFDKQSGKLDILDVNFKMKSSRVLVPKSNLLLEDLNNDGENEFIFSSLTSGQLTIYDHNLGNCLELALFPTSNEIIHYSVSKADNSHPLLYFQKGNIWHKLTYIQNPFYWLKYLFYLGVFLTILLFEILIIKGYKIRADKKKAIENQIYELQIKSIKNQVDPHFVFNAINTIGEMVLTDDKQEADTFICHFSDLMRLTLKNSDKISHTLREEVEYIDKYIILQRTRFNNSFNFQVKLDDNVNHEAVVPKHVLHTYVENAIKHGLSGKTDGGQLNIKISYEKNMLLLVVQDNGNGLCKTSNPKIASTGNGLKIMNQIFILYSKIHKSKITHSLKEIRDANNNVKGVLAEISISQ